MILGETFHLLQEILEVMWDHIRIRIKEYKIIEVAIEETIGMQIITEVGVGLEKGNIKAILEGMIEVVAADLGQYQEQVQIGMEYDVISAESMIIVPKIAQQQKQRKKQTKYSKCLI